MIIEQKQWTVEKGWMYRGVPKLVDEPQFVLVFGARALLEDPIHLAEIQSMYTRARILMCSTAGEIFDTNASDNTMVLTAIFFEKTTLIPAIC